MVSIPTTRQMSKFLAHVVLSLSIFDGCLMEPKKSVLSGSNCRHVGVYLHGILPKEMRLFKFEFLY